MTLKFGRRTRVQVARGEFTEPDAVPEAELDVFDATVAPFQLISPPEEEDS